MAVLVAFVAGVLVAGAVYLARRVRERSMEPAVLRQAWGIDALYAGVIETPGLALSSWLAYVLDTKVIDGAVNGVGSTVRTAGARLRRVQTGYVRNYALGIGLGVVAVLAFMATRGAP